MNIMFPREAEWALVGILASGRTIPHKDDLSRLKGTDFGDAEAGTVYDAEMAMLGKRKVPTVGTLALELVKIFGDRRSDEVMEKVVACVSKYGLNGHAIPQYVAAIEEGARRRSLDILATEIRRSAADPAANTIEAADRARSELRKTVRETGQWISGAEAAMMAFENAEHRLEAVETGFSELDDTLCGGLTKPELTIVGARPGTGKSAFLLAVAMNAARNKKHVAYVSLEMSAVQLGQRALAESSLVSVSKQRSGADALNDHDWAAMSDALTLLGNDGTSEYLHMFPTYEMTVERLGGVAQDAMDRWGLDLLVVDYIQLLRTAETTRSVFERLSTVSRKMKELALMLNLPILTAAQVRRQENRGGAPRAPGLDELRGTGDFEQDADNVLLIHMPESPDDETLKRITPKHSGIYERAVTAFAKPFTVEVAKQRQGPKLRTWCLFKASTMRFYEDVQGGGGDTSWATE